MRGPELLEANTSFTRQPSTLKTFAIPHVKYFGMHANSNSFHRFEFCMYEHFQAFDLGT